MSNKATDESTGNFKFVRFKKKQSVIFPHVPLRMFGGNSMMRKNPSIFQHKDKIEQMQSASNNAYSKSEFNLTDALKDFPTLQSVNKQKSSLSKYYSESDVHLLDKRSYGDAWSKFLAKVAQFKDVIPAHLQENVGDISKTPCNQHQYNACADKAPINMKPSCENNKIDNYSSTFKEEDLEAYCLDIALGRELLAELDLGSPENPCEDEKWKVAEGTPYWWKHPTVQLQSEKTDLPIYKSYISNTSGTEQKSLIYENECATYASYVVTHAAPPNAEYNKPTDNQITATYKYFAETPEIPKPPKISQTLNQKTTTYASHLAKSGSRPLQPQTVVKETNKVVKKVSVQANQDKKENYHGTVTKKISGKKYLNSKTTQPRTPAVFANKDKKHHAENTPRFVLLGHVINANTNREATTDLKKYVEKKSANKKKSINMQSTPVSGKLPDVKTQESVSVANFQHPKYRDQETQTCHTYFSTSDQRQTKEFSNDFRHGDNSNSLMYVTHHTNLQNINYYLNQDSSMRNNYMFDHIFNMYPSIHTTDSGDGRSEWELQGKSTRDLTEETLFYIFYCVTGDTLQVKAAAELFYRGWRFHLEDKVWVTRICLDLVEEITSTYEQGVFYVFDPTWWIKCKRRCILEYDKLQLYHPYT